MSLSSNALPPSSTQKNVRVLEKGALADNYVQNLYTKKHDLAKKHDYINKGF